MPLFQEAGDFVVSRLAYISDTVRVLPSWYYHCLVHTCTMCLALVGAVLGVPAAINGHAAGGKHAVGGKHAAADEQAAGGEHAVGNKQGADSEHAMGAKRGSGGKEGTDGSSEGNTCYSHLPEMWFDFPTSWSIPVGMGLNDAHKCRPP